MIPKSGGVGDVGCLVPIADRKAPGLTYLTLSRTFSYRALFCPMVLFPGLLPDPLNKSVGFVQQ